jgi:hypothetical protein
MDISNLQYFCGLANKKDYESSVKVFSEEKNFSFKCLTKNNNLFFKDVEGGNVYGAPSFLNEYRKKDWDRIETILIDCGLSMGEAKKSIQENKRLLKINREIKKFKDDFRFSNQESGVNFGEWLRIEKRKFFEFFGPIKIKSQLVYNCLLLRDESGIPSSILVHTINFNFLGEINLGITQSNFFIQYSEEINKVPWSFTGQVLTQNKDVAAAAHSSLVGSHEVFPIGNIVSCLGDVNFGSVPAPTTYWVCEREEKPEKIISYLGPTKKLFSCRLPHKINESMFTSIPSSMKEIKNRSKDFCVDVATEARKNEVYDLEGFAKVFLDSPSISSSSKKEMIKAFSEVTHADEDAVFSIIQRYTSPIIEGGVISSPFFASGGRYYICKCNKNTVATNFVITPVSKFSVGLRSGVEMLITIEGENKKIYLDVDSFVTPLRLIKSITSRLLEIGGPIPVVYENSIKSPLFCCIVDYMNTLRTKTVPPIGLHGSKYVSSHWKVEDRNISFSTIDDIADQEDVFNWIPGELSVHEYLREVRDLVVENKNNKTFKAAVAAFLSLLDSLKSEKITQIKVSKDVLYTLSHILKVKIDPATTPDNQILLCKNKRKKVCCIYSDTGGPSDSVEDNILFNDYPSMAPLLISTHNSLGSIKALRDILEVGSAEAIMELRDRGIKNLFRDYLKTIILFGKERDVVFKMRSGDVFISVGEMATSLGEIGIEVSPNTIIASLKRDGVRFTTTRKFHERKRGVLINENVYQSIKNSINN